MAKVKGIRGDGAVLFAALALALSNVACSRTTPADAGRANASGSANASTQATDSGGVPGAPADTAKLDAEVDRLEKQAERNPADEDSRAALAKAYVRRGNALRDARRLREALLDYQKALRNDPDNEEAQRNVAEITPLVESTPPTGENGEPAPLPISPNVTDEDEQATPQATPQPTPRKP
ncbi:MAG TPA: tetratricopeptide repeat protein [Pyrinomonadaceae bacterium]|jgi:tetratricopeptide (TPR) repeat protein|nr:tetratricopeptide repeat protein [Pyrinomonadaceae bacterium]